MFQQIISVAVLCLVYYNYCGICIKNVFYDLKRRLHITKGFHLKDGFPLEREKKKEERGWVSFYAARSLIKCKSWGDTKSQYLKLWVACTICIPAVSLHACWEGYWHLLVVVSDSLPTAAPLSGRWTTAHLAGPHSCIWYKPLGGGTHNCVS